MLRDTMHSALEFRRSDIRTYWIESSYLLKYLTTRSENLITCASSHGESTDEKVLV